MIIGPLFVQFYCKFDLHAGDDSFQYVGINYNYIIIIHVSPIIRLGPQWKSD
jgi:hypothetical protein